MRFHQLGQMAERAMLQKNPFPPRFLSVQTLTSVGLPRLCSQPGGKAKQAKRRQNKKNRADPPWPFHLFSCHFHFASGSGLIWKCTTNGVVPLPPSDCQGSRVSLAPHSPRPFHPVLGSSMRPSRLRVKSPMGYGTRRRIHFFVRGSNATRESEPDPLTTERSLPRPKVS